MRRRELAIRIDSPLIALALAFTAPLGLAQPAPLSNAAKPHPFIVVTEPAYSGGAKCDGSTDDYTAIQAALTAAGNISGGATVRFPAGRCKVASAALSKPPGVSMRGEGMDSTTIACFGAHNCIDAQSAGPSYDRDGVIEELALSGNSGALDGISANYRYLLTIRRLRITGFTRRAIHLNNTIMTRLEQSLVMNSGSASYGQIEIDNSTTVRLDQMYVATSNRAALGGVLIDRTTNTQIIGGAIESTNTPLKIGSKRDAITGCVGGIVEQVDLENPGNGNPYIDLGAGLSGTAYVQGWGFRNMDMTPSGTTSNTYGVLMARVHGAVFDKNNIALAGKATSFYELSGTDNRGIRIAAYWPNFGGRGAAWVRRNGTLVKAAGPHYDWDSEMGGVGVKATSYSVGVLSQNNATPSILLSTTQGGYYAQVLTHNTVPTTIAALTGGERGMEITMIAGDRFTTLAHSTTAADQFNLVGGTNLTLASGKAYRFIHDGTLWVQLQ